MGSIEDIKEILYGYETAGLIDGDPHKVLSYLSDDVMGIGMGEQGFVSSKQEIQDIMLATAKRDENMTYELDIQDIVIHMVTDCSANLCARVYVRCDCQGKITTSGFMQSLSLVLRGGVWYICSLHASPIMLTEECIESYPLTFADNTLAQLRSELSGEAYQLIIKSLSAGVLGTYTRKPYPVCLANDYLLKMLGYERDEFEELFHDGFEMIVGRGEQVQLMEQRRREDDSGDFFSRVQWRKKDGALIWVECCTHRTKDGHGSDIYLTVAVDVTEVVNLQQEADEQNQTILSSIRYAGKIQKNFLPPESAFEQAFSDYAVLWRPMQVIGGDIYWLKRFGKETVLCVCDCTGHGIPGALLTILVTTVLDSAVKEGCCADTAQIVWELDRRMAQMLNAAKNDRGEICDGCDLAVLFISGEGDVTLSAGNMSVLVCDGSEVRRLKGQRLRVGEGLLRGHGDVNVITIPFDENQKFYVASDGLFDQIGGKYRMPFGYRAVQELLLNYHGESQAEIVSGVWEAFEQYRGENSRRDDVELIAFKP